MAFIMSGDGIGRSIGLSKKPLSQYHNQFSSFAIFARIQKNHYVDMSYTPKLF